MTTLSGVGGVLSCAHRDQDTGKLHGHTWEVVAWFNRRGDAKQRLITLNQVLGTLDHDVLPDRLAWGEDLAEHIARRIGFPCCKVDVNRPAERIYASYEVPPAPLGWRRWTPAESARALVLRTLGFTYAEIAHDLGDRTAKAVKRHVQALGG